MTELKTKKNNQDVEQFIDAVDEKRKDDCKAVLKMMEEVTGAKPAMWGPSIVGFGSYHYKYQSGREGDWFLTGFSPRKQNLTLYIMPGFEKYPTLMKKLGKFKTGKSCLYIKKLEDVDMKALRQLVKESVAHLKKNGKEIANLWSN